MIAELASLYRRTGKNPMAKAMTVFAAECQKNRHTRRCPFTGEFRKPVNDTLDALRVVSVAVK